jgi:hypothetical protein
MMRGAAAAAEDLNVEPFQGLTEVIQNADDLRAWEARFAFRDTDASRELLIVHNGQPVACQHVLGRRCRSSRPRLIEPISAGGSALV